MKKLLPKLLVLGMFIAIVGAFFYFGLAKFLSFDYLKEQQDVFKDYYEQNRFLVIATYMIAYIISAAASLPGAAILTLAGGAIFGFGTGLIAVSFASTIGATLAFLVSRFLFREAFESKFGDRLRKINAGIEKEGWFYLLTLRLVPVFPFFLVNILMGLTKMRTLTYYIVSQVGMLPGTAVYVAAGAKIATIDSAAGILDPGTIGLFALLALLSRISKGLIDIVKAAKVYGPYRKNKPQKFDYNMIVIGAGSAGLVSAYIAAAVKAKVLLIEKHKMGGDCLNTGCVPSKAMIRSAKMLSYAKRAKDWGFEAVDVKFDFATVMERVQRVIKKVEPHDSVERYTGLGVECLTAAATIIDPWHVSANGKTYTTKNIVVATGARPNVPNFPGIDQIKYYTSDTIWELRVLPKRLLVLGGGPIGCELAQCFRRFGSEVTIVDSHPMVLAREDDDVAKFVHERFSAEGIKSIGSHRVKEFRKKDGRDVCVVQNVSTNAEMELEFDEVLIVLGRKANVTGFGLENLGVEIRGNGTIEADEFLRTKYPNIFVCGDVTGPFQFTHTAAHQAWFCAVNALFSPFKKFKVDYSVIPWCTYTDPEIATVGHTEKSAKAAGIPYEVTTYGIDDLDRAIADDEDHGMVKVLTVPGKDKIIGATIVGSHAGDIIIEYVAAMKHGFGMNKILGTIHIYPTLGESNKYAAGNWKRNHKPDGLLEYVAKFHSWRRS